MKDRMDTGGRSCGEEIGGVGGQETVIRIRIHCIKQINFQKRGKNKIIKKKTG